MAKEYIGPVGEGIHVIRTGDWRTKRPVLDQATCRRCGICLMHCPVNSIVRTAEGAYEIDLSYCKGCGICAAECPFDVIRMEKEAKS